MIQTLTSYGDRTYYIYSSQSDREGHACKCKQAKDNKSSMLYRAPKQNMPNHLTNIIIILHYVGGARGVPDGPGPPRPSIKIARSAKHLLAHHAN
jgi:hypothetical protein